MQLYIYNSLIINVVIGANRGIVGSFDGWGNSWLGGGGGGGGSIRHGVFLRGKRLIQPLYLKGALTRYEAFIWEWVFIRSFMYGTHFFLKTSDFIIFLFQKVTIKL